MSETKYAFFSADTPFCFSFIGQVRAVMQQIVSEKKLKITQKTAISNL